MKSLARRNPRTTTTRASGIERTSVWGPKNSSHRIVRRALAGIENMPATSWSNDTHGPIHRGTQGRTEGRKPTCSHHLGRYLSRGVQYSATGRSRTKPVAATRRSAMRAPRTIRCRRQIRRAALLSLARPRRSRLPQDLRRLQRQPTSVVAIAPLSHEHMLPELLPPLPVPMFPPFSRPPHPKVAITTIDEARRLKQIIEAFYLSETRRLHLVTAGSRRQPARQWPAPRRRRPPWAGPQPHCASFQAQALNASWAARSASGNEILCDAAAATANGTRDPCGQASGIHWVQQPAWALAGSYPAGAGAFVVRQ
jgi:hypothetical protein